MIDLETLGKIIIYEVNDEPLWGDDAGRETMDGAYSGTFIGYFTKIVINIGKLKQSEMTNIKNKFKTPFVEVSYTNPDNGNKVKEKFYGAALSAKILKIGRYDQQQITLVAVKRQVDSRVQL